MSTAVFVVFAVDEQLVLILMTCMPRVFQLNMNKGYMYLQYVVFVVSMNCLGFWYTCTHWLREYLYGSHGSQCLRFSSENVNREYYSHAPIECGV